MQNRILIVVPVYFRHPEMVACLESLAGTVVDGLHVKVIFAVNGCDVEQLEYLRLALAHEVPGIPEGSEAWIHVFNKNLGKGWAVNECVKRELLSMAQDYIVVLDSDMVALAPDWLLKLLECSKLVLDHDRLGAVCAGHAGDIRHLPEAPRMLVHHGFSLTLASGNKGIYGGCLLAPVAVFDLVGGYREDCPTGSEDQCFLRDLFYRGHKAAIANDVKFFHSFYPTRTFTCFPD